MWNSSDSQQQRETSSEDDDGDIVDINVYVIKFSLFCKWILFLTFLMIE